MSIKNMNGKLFFTFKHMKREAREMLVPSFNSGEALDFSRYNTGLSNEKLKK